jgi:hypothetical protein
LKEREIRYGVSKRFYAVARLRKSEMKKLRNWLDRKDVIEIATHASDGTLYLLNETKIHHW